MEHKLQIRFINRSCNWISRLISSEIIQTKSFEFGFVLKNIGSDPINGATISNIQWKSANGHTLISTVSKSFHLDTLNPDEEKKIWVDKTGTYVHGLCNIKLIIRSDKPEDTIKTFQVDSFTKTSEPLEDNKWEDFFFVREKAEYEQNLTNFYLLGFTILSVVLTLINLDYTKVQVESILTERMRNEFQARQYCLSNPTGQWPKAAGGYFNCPEILTIFGSSTAYKNTIVPLPLMLH